MFEVEERANDGDYSLRDQDIPLRPVILREDGYRWLDHISAQTAHGSRAQDTSRRQRRDELERILHDQNCKEHAACQVNLWPEQFS